MLRRFSKDLSRSRRSLINPKNESNIYQFLDECDMISCLIKTKQWSVLSDLIEKNQDFAKVRIDIVENGKYIQRLPIHEICRHRPPLNLIEVLVMAHPSSLSLKDVNNDH